MDARLIRAALIVSVLFSAGATFPSENFVVHAPTPDIARRVAQTAELYRKELAIEWTGQEMPRWAKPCEVHVKVGQLGAGGATTFAFHQGEVFGWRMTVQGSLERVLDSVIPHEVSHTVFASHFRRALPRWADEGAATLIEHESERKRQELLLQQVWKTKKRIPLRNLLAITEYPEDMQDVLTLYAEGYSLADFLVQNGGRARFLAFLDDAHSRGWEKAIQHHYGLKGVGDLESKWDGWMMAGSPRLQLPAGQQLASAERSPAVIRAQNADASGEDPIVTDNRVAASDVQSPALSSAEAPAAPAAGPGGWSRFDGRQRAADAGWIPAAETVAAAPATAEFAARETARSVQSAVAPANVDFATDAVRELPRSDGRREESREPASRSHTVPEWSNFPAARTPATSSNW